MKKRNIIVSMIMAFILAAGTVLPSAAAESSGIEAAAEMENSSEAYAEIQEEITEEEQRAEKAEDKDILSDRGNSAGMPEEESEAEIPFVRNASTGVDQEGNSTWLSDYSYEVKDGRLTLTGYHGTGTDVTVPGWAYVSYTFYDRVYLTAKMWGTTVTSLSFEKGVTLPEDSSLMFAYSYGSEKSSLERFDGRNLDTSSVTDMNRMFCNCVSLTELNLSGFDTSSVSSMALMFTDCHALTELDLSGFDTSSVTKMSQMFSGCNALKSLDLSSFDTSSVTDMHSMFWYCSALTELDLSGLETSSVTDMSDMFSDCSSLTELDLSGLETSSVTDMSGMFSDCSSLTELDLSGLETSSVTDMSDIFSDCSSLTELDLSGLETSSVTDMSGMFFDCLALTKLKLTGFDTSSVTNMERMFSRCHQLTELDLTGFDTSSVISMLEMFFECKALTRLDLSGFDLSSLTSADRMLDFSSVHRNMVIITPVGLSREIALDASGGNYYDEAGNTYTILPRNKDSSIRIVQNGKIAFTSQPSSVTAVPGDNAAITAEFSGVPKQGVWQYREAGAAGWTDYKLETEEENIRRLIVPVSPDWNGRTLRLVLTDVWGKQIASNGALLTVQGDISVCSISASPISFVYTGKENRPKLTVKKGSALFVQDRDYTVTYSNNINAGTGKALVKGKGCCTGSKEIYFMISKADQNVQISASQTRVIAGKTCRVSVTGAAGSVTYSSSQPSVAVISADGTLTAVSLGRTTITASVAETTNYLSGSASLNITVTNEEGLPEEKDIALCTVTLAKSSYPFTGADIIPEVTVKDGAVILKAGTDYSVTCSNNRDAGTASVLIAGKGDYTGSATQYFTITRIDQEIEAVISDSQLKAGETARITVTGNMGDLVYTSSDAAVASVDGTGLVSALSAGEAVITVTAGMTTNYNQAEVRLPVTVAPAQQDTGRNAEEISYSFSNSLSSFGYPSDYRIPLSSYQVIYGDNTRAEAVYTAHSRNSWGGNCAGISATAALLTTAGSGLHPYTFRTGASLPKELSVSDTSSSLSMNLTKFVEAMHIAQYTAAFSGERKSHLVLTSAIHAGNASLDGLYNAVKNKASSEIPTVLALTQDGRGHAVLAYKTEEVSTAESRIYIYDSNFPLEDRYIIMKKHSGHYNEWSYDMGSFGEWGTDFDSSGISYISYETIKSIWDSRGNVGRDEANLAIVNSQNFAVYDVQGNLEAIVNSGKLTDNTGKISLIEDELSLTGGKAEDVILSLPTKTHTIVNLDRNLHTFAVNMVDTDLGVNIETTVQEVTISVDDAYNINTLVMEAGANDTYSVTLSSSFAAGYDEVVVTGKGQGEILSISQSGTNLNLINCDISLLMVDGKQVGVYDIQASSTGGGRIDPAGKTSVRKGESVTYTIVPNEGYAVSSVVVDDEDMGPVTSYTFNSVSKDHSIYVVFRKNAASLSGSIRASLASDGTGKAVTTAPSGTKVLISAKGVGGSAPYTYKFLIYDNGAGTWYKLRDFTGTSTYTWTPGVTGTKTLFVDIKDAAGTTCRAKLSGFVVTEKQTALSGTVKASLASDSTGAAITTAPSGSKVLITAKGAGGSGGYTYKFLIYDNGAKTWYKFRDFTSTNTYTWTPGVTGTKTLFVDVKDSAGTTVRVKLSGFVVTEKQAALSGTVKASLASDSTGVPITTAPGGTKVLITAKGSGGSGSYTYKFLIYDNGAGTWFKLRDFTTTNSYTWTTGATGTKTLFVDIKDSAGKTVRVKLSGFVVQAK